MTLIGVLVKHPDELAADMRRFYNTDWRILPGRQAAALCAVMIRQPESWVHRALNPDWQWADLSNQLGVAAVDLLQLLWWAKTKDGQNNRNRPTPFPRPVTKIQGNSELMAMPIDELEKRLAAPR